MREYLFVYGTLLPRKAPAEVAGVVKQLRAIGKAYVRGRLYDFGDYPAAVIDGRSRQKIEGLLFEVPPNLRIFTRLDRYEGYDENDPKNSLFVRRKRLVMLNGRRVRSWIYEYNRKPASAARVNRNRFTATI